MTISMAGSSETWLTTSEVADRLGWDARTVRRACEDGSLRATRLRRGGQWRIPESVVDGILDAIRPFKRTNRAG